MKNLDIKVQNEAGWDSLSSTVLGQQQVELKKTSCNEFKRVLVIPGK